MLKSAAFRIALVNGDILMESSNLLVNAANSEMNHAGGGTNRIISLIGAAASLLDLSGWMSANKLIFYVK